MQFEKVTPGVILASKFIISTDEKFQTYIDYIDRHSAIRNQAFSKYSAYVDYYMDNPDKWFNPKSDSTSALFTQDKAMLKPDEKEKIKEAFEMAQENESIMWQNVISFDDNFLIEHDLKNKKTGYVNEKALQRITRKAMSAMLKNENMEQSAIWTADIHYNTDNIHIHVAVVEPSPTRKIIEDGEYKGQRRGKLKQSTLDSMKSKVVNEIVDNKEHYAVINIITDKIILANMRETSIEQETELQKMFLDLYRTLPDDKRAWQYGMNKIAHLRPGIDEISKAFIDKYHKDDLDKLNAELDTMTEKLKEAYGEGMSDGKGKNYKDFKGNQLKAMYKKLGNALLQEMKEYDKQKNIPPNEDKKIPHSEDKIIPHNEEDTPSHVASDKGEDDIERPDTIFSFLNDNVLLTDIIEAQNLQLNEVYGYSLVEAPHIKIHGKTDTYYDEEKEDGGNVVSFVLDYLKESNPEAYTANATNLLKRHYAVPQKKTQRELRQHADYINEYDYYSNDIDIIEVAGILGYALQEEVIYYEIEGKENLHIYPGTNHYYNADTEKGGGTLNFLTQELGMDNYTALLYAKDNCNVPIPKKYEEEFARMQGTHFANTKLRSYKGLRSAISNFRRACSSATSNQNFHSQREYQKLLHKLVSGERKEEVKMDKDLDY